MSRAIAGNPSGWQTAFDINFVNQPTQSLSPDGNYTIGGVVFTKINSANDNAAMVLTNGQGIVITPKQVTQLYPATRTLPALYVPLNSVIPSFSHLMRIRARMYIASGNWAANYDSVNLAIENPTTNTGYHQAKDWSTFLRCWTGASTAGVDRGMVDSTAALASTNVIVMDLICTARGVIHLVGTWAAGWPAANTLSQFARRLPNVYTSGTLSTLSSWGAPTAWNLLFGAARQGSATAFVTKIGALKLEYMS